MKKIWFIIFLLYNGISQGQTFDKVIKHSNRDFGISILETTDHHIIVAGITTGGSQREVFLYKTDTVGNVYWKKTIKSAIGALNVFKIYESEDGNYVIAGDCSAPGPINIYNVLIKVDTACNIIWSKNYQNPSVYYIYNVIKTIDKGFVFMNSGSGSVFYISKVDSAGNLQWFKEYDLTSSVLITNSSNDISETQNGDLLITALIICLQSCAYPVKMKLNSQGDIIWSKVINHTGSFEKFIESGNNYFVTTRVNDIAIIKMDTAGNIISSRGFNVPNAGLYIKSAQTDQNSGIYLAGISTGINWTRPFVAHADSSGSIDYYREYQYANMEQKFNDFQISTDHNFYFTGSALGQGTDTNDVILVKDNLLAAHCNSINQMITDSVIQFQDSMVTMTSSIDSFTTVSDSIYVLNDTLYTDSVLCDLQTSVNPLNKSEEFEIYPNPGSGIFKVKIQEMNIPGEIYVLDILGSQVLRKNVSPGQNEILLDLNFLKPGIYNMILYSKNSKTYRRIILGE